MTHLKDTTSEEDLEAEKVIEELSHKIKRNEMLVNLAHDMGNPLASIKTHLQLMAQGVVPAGDPQTLKEMLKKVDYMDHLVQGIFLLSNLETKQVTLNKELILAGTWIGEVHNDLEKELSVKGINLHLGEKANGLRENPGKWGTVNIDRNKMSQVLNNYMDNAVKASHKRNVTIILEAAVKAAPEGHSSQLLVQVLDQGLGVAEDDQAHLFHRSYTKAGEDQFGRGLGLAIAKEIIHLHEGRVGFSTQAQQGSVFYFTLPITFGNQSQKV